LSLSRPGLFKRVRAVFRSLTEIHMKLRMQNNLVAFLLAGLALALTLSACGSKEGEPAPEGGIDYYTCSMHPSIREKKPGTCPICGMDLIPVAKKTTAAHGDHAHAAAIPSAPSTPSESPAPPSDEGQGTGNSAFHIAPERLQAIGVRFTVIQKEQFHRLLRAPGVVAIDESTLRDVNVKTADGYIEKLYADYTGKSVRKNEPLALILSKGWIEAQQEYIRAYRAWRRTDLARADRNPAVLEQEFNRMRARLRVWDLTDEQLKKLEDFALNLKDFDLSLRTGQGQGLSGFFELKSPIDGIVVEKNVVEGAKFGEGQTLFKLARLSPIWIEAEFPEDQAPYVSVGQKFDVAYPALPQLRSQAKVAFLYPQIDRESRRLKVRFVLDNPQMKLLPGMYANVSCSQIIGEILAVPFDAVIPTGDRFVVFLDHGEGQLEPRYIQVGEKFGDHYQLLSGLKEGDRVVAGANFLIDSESRIQGALKIWSGSASAPAPIDPHAGHGPSH